MSPGKSVYLFFGLALFLGCDGLGGSGKVWSRDEFRSAIMGKTKHQVINILGRPDSTQELPGSQTSWFYNQRTKNGSGKNDATAQVTFQGGVVVRINY